MGPAAGRPLEVAAAQHTVQVGGRKFLLYVLLAAMVLLQVRRELADASSPDLGTIRNPVAEEADNSSKKKSNERKAAEETGDLHQ